jgi:hypothetical protein
VSRDLTAKFDVERYRSLGLIANPFAVPENRDAFSSVEAETAAEADTLLRELLVASNETAPKPIVVSKVATGVPSAYFMRAAALTQRSLASDEHLNVTFGYVQLFMMRLGRVRSIINVVAERLVFRDFDRTLALYIESLLAEHDTDLVSFQLLGESALNEFADRFKEDPIAVTKKLFGGARIERHPELAQMPDRRLSDLETDVAEDDVAVVQEIDASVGDSAANAVLLAAQADTEEMSEEERLEQALVDYIIEYAKVHYSPVIARALRVYRERGQVAATNELKVTKAPKKTLQAIVRFALIRFKKVALLFDGFDTWYTVPSELKMQIASTLSEVRWALDGIAVVAVLLEEGKVPELEEQFGQGVRVKWAFPSLNTVLDEPYELNRDVIESWLARAAYPGAQPLTLEDPVLSQLFESSTGLSDFALRAATAIENAAERGAEALDEVALSEALEVTPPEANEE